MALTGRAKIAMLAVGLVLFFLSVALLVLPTVLVNRPDTRAAVARSLGAALGGSVDFDRLALSLFPRPCVTAAGVRLELPERAAGRAAQIDICLRLLPLLRGRVAVDSARVRSPDVVLPLTALGLAAGGSPPADPRGLLSAALAALQRIPDGALDIVDGRLALSGPADQRTEFHGLNLHMERRQAELQWTLSAGSGFLRSFSSQARLDLESVRGSLTVAMADFQPGEIFERLWPDSPVRLLDGRADLDLVLGLGGPDRLTARLEGRLPSLNLRRSDRQTRIAIDRLTAELELTPRTLSLRIPELAAEQPRARMALSLVVDEDRQPRIALDIDGRGDAGDAREAARALLRDPEVEGVCDILRGGEVSGIQVRLHATTWPELTRLPNLEIQARLENGRVHLPWIDLDLDTVSGDARIAGGILEGRRLKAHFKGTHAENGTLRVGLSPADPVLELDLFVHAALAPLPALMARSIPDPEFRRKVARIQEFSGSAQGRLRLDGTYTDIRVGVQASELDVSARLQDIPHPLRLQGGEFAYGGDAISLRGVEVAIGRSTLRMHELTLGLTGDLPVEASSSRAVIDLAEAFNLLRERPPFNQLHRLGGTVTFSQFRLAGRLLDPASWELALSATVSELAVESTHLPGLLRSPSSRLDWLGRTIRYESARGSINRSEIRGLAVEADYAGPPRVQVRALELDAALEDVSVLLRAFPKAAGPAAGYDPLTGTVRMRDVGLRARLLADDLVVEHFKAGFTDSRIVAAPVGLPLALASGDILWQGSRLQLRIAGASLGQSSVQTLSLDLNAGDGGLALSADDVFIACGEVFAHIVPLAGLERLREDVRSVQGALRLPRLALHGPLRDPGSWRVRAVSDLDDIVVTTTFLDEPIGLPRGRLTLAQPEAGPTTLHLDAARVRVGTGEAVLTGDVTLSAADTRLQLAVAAEVIDWETVETISERLALRRTTDSRPVSGRLSLRLERLVIDRVHVYPAYAEVQLTPDGARIDIERAGFCGMTFIGRMAFDGPMVDAYLVPIVDVMPLDGVVYCLSEEKSIFSGNFNLDGELRFKARREDVISALNGRLTFVAEDGTIQQSLLFARLFSLINLTEIYRGKLPDFRSQGLDYKRSIARIEVRDGKIRVEDWSLDGHTVWIGSRGTIDIATQAIDFTIMVSPFKTFDRIINSIPGLRWILGGRLVAIPMRAVGVLEDPQIIPLSPSAVGTSILDMIERTLLLPIEIIQPLVPGMEGRSRGTISR
jgi:hypothetical protein